MYAKIREKITLENEFFCSTETIRTHSVPLFYSSSHPDSPQKKNHLFSNFSIRKFLIHVKAITNIFSYDSFFLLPLFLQLLLLKISLPRFLFPEFHIQSNIICKVVCLKRAFYQILILFEINHNNFVSLL